MNHVKVSQENCQKLTSQGKSVAGNEKELFFPEPWSSQSHLESETSMLLWYHWTRPHPDLFFEFELQLIDPSLKIQTSRSMPARDCVQFMYTGLFSFFLFFGFKRHLSESINQVNYVFRWSVLFGEGAHRGLPWPPGWTAEWSCSALTLTSLTSATLLPLSHLFLSLPLVECTRFFISFLLGFGLCCSTM